jgi:alkylated DNA nucleotide flippase Atl1
MASARATALAEVLWELKRADKYATCSAVARRAGFAPGPDGRIVKSSLDVVRQEWPHLQWWRVLPDDGRIEAAGPLAQQLRDNGVTLESDAKTPHVHVLLDERTLMVWASTAAAAATVVEVVEETVVIAEA